MATSRRPQVLNFTSIDRFGIQSVCVVRVVAVDVIPPTIQCPAPMSFTLAVGQHSVNSSCALTAVNTINTSLAGVGCGADGWAADDIAVDTLSREPFAGAAFGVGVHTVRYTVRDWRGNTASCNTTVTVIDTEAPVVTCPESLSLPESDASLQTPVRVCGNATDNDALVLATLSTNSTPRVTLNIATLSGGDSSLSFGFSRKASSADVLVYRFCVTVFVPTPSSQNFTLRFVDRSNNADSCQFSVSVAASARTAALSNLLESLAGPVSQQTLDTVTNNLQNLTRDVNDLTPAQFSRSALVVQQLVASTRSLGPPNVTQAAQVVDIFDQICGVSRDNAEQAQSSDGGIGIVRDAIASFVEMFNGSTSAFEYTGENLALSIQTIPPGNFTGLSYRAPFNSSVVFDIPALPIAGATIAFTTYPDDRMFPQSPAAAATSDAGQVASGVIDVTVVGVDTSNLNPPARFGLSVPATSRSNVRYNCVYYNVTAQIWASDGVNTLGQQGTSISCSTAHFTNFAVLVVSTCCEPSFLLCFCVFCFFKLSNLNKKPKEVSLIIFYSDCLFI